MSYSRHKVAILYAFKIVKITMMNILFICTHNRCRSILAEAITNHIAQQANLAITAFSAGSQPEGVVHPMSLHYLSERGISTQGLQSQSWDLFQTQDIDIAITVCDNAAGESCPLYLGSALKVHWPLADPSKCHDHDQEKQFNRVIDDLERRIRAIVKIFKHQPLKAHILQTQLMNVGSHP